MSVDWLTKEWLGAPRWMWPIPGAALGYILGQMWRRREGKVARMRSGRNRS